MAYEYKVDHINAAVTDKDVRSGGAGGKVSAQVEIKLAEWVDKGFELFRSDVVNVTVQQTGCFGGKTGQETSVNLLVFIFRREIR